MSAQPQTPHVVYRVYSRIRILHSLSRILIIPLFFFLRPAISRDSGPLPNPPLARSVTVAQRQRNPAVAAVPQPHCIQSFDHPLAHVAFWSPHGRITHRPPWRLAPRLRTRTVQVPTGAYILAWRTSCQQASSICKSALATSPRRASRYRLHALGRLLPHSPACRVLYRP